MRFSQCRLAFVFLYFPLVLSVLVNVTIDDTFGDPLTGNHIDYSPLTSWNIGANCDGCTTAPDPSQVYNHTWHDGTFNRNAGSNPSPNAVLLASVPFFGNAVYVYCILSESESSPASDMSFFIDMEQVGTFTQQPLGQSGFQYNVLVYSNTSLPSTDHTLTIQNGHVGGNKSLILLDYVVYSYDDGTHVNTTAAVPKPQSDTSEPTSSSNKSRVVGAVLGTLFALLFLGLAFVAYRRYKKGQPIIPVARSPQPGSVKRWFSTSFFASAGSYQVQNRTSLFNPQLLVQKVKNRMSAHTSPRAPQPPPKSRPQYLSHYSTEIPYLNQTGERSSPAPLLAAAYGVGQSPMPHYPSGSSFSSKMESIHRWQRQTMEETRGARIQSVHMSVELSSYYDDNATESHRVRTPPPPPRRYTVVNN